MSVFESRREKVQKLLRSQGADALLVTNFANVTYLTGFTGDDSYLLLTRAGQIVISDPRYTTQLEEECPGVECSIRPLGMGMIQAVATVIGSAKVRKLGMEGDSIT